MLFNIEMVCCSQISLRDLSNYIDITPQGRTEDIMEESLDTGILLADISTERSEVRCTLYLSHDGSKTRFVPIQRLIFTCQTLYGKLMSL